MAAIATTPWGKARVVEEIELVQRAPDREFASVVQLLETAGGELLVRFAYHTGGAARRGPVTLRSSDLEALRSQLRERRARARALGLHPRRGGGASEVG